METAYMLGGGQALIKEYQINETFADSGIVVLAPAEGQAGVQISTTTSFANAVGVTIGTKTYVTAQQTDGTSAERLIKVVVSPDAVFRALMSGGATEGTALTRYPVTTASSNGLSVTTASVSDWTSPDFDDGTVWFEDGANVGQERTVLSGSSTVATLQVAFDQDTVVGDNLLRCPYSRLNDIAKTLQITTLLYQADASIAVATNGGAVKIIDMELNGVADSFVHFILDDHLLNRA